MEIALLAGITLAAIGIVCNTLLFLAIIIDPLGILRKGAWMVILNGYSKPSARGPPVLCKRLSVTISIYNRGTWGTN